MTTEVEFDFISPDESWEVFDEAAHRLLDMSGDEFARRWDAGAYAQDDQIEVMQVAMLRPGGRRNERPSTHPSGG
jgi:hypothetical protein